MRVNIEEKIKIAKSAINLVKEGDILLLGGGSTISELAKLLINFSNLKKGLNLLPD